MALYKGFIRGLLFRMEAEQAHRAVLSGLDAWAASRLGQRKAPASLGGEVQVFGLRFPNRVGLAAGMDKDGEHIRGFERLGFGHLELGTVTPRPQVGNPKPRMFRLPRDRAIINRMGFNNKGVEHLKRRLAETERSVVIGANIGKNKDTPNPQAHLDYLHCFTELVPYCDYFTVNVSSPNTPGLRELQHEDRLRRILSELQSENIKYKDPRPILLKLAPDLAYEDVEKTVQVALESGISGLVLTNTTVARQHLHTNGAQVKAIGNGGLSGAPLKAAAQDILRFVKQELAYPYPVIGVGGIMSGAEGQARLEAGAGLIQVYSGLVYEGPHLVQDLASL